ncbi:MAG TPA: hypothetical protein VFD43_04330 [Planctomycetota bacterium]|nr:hypothetical protein [Planctomycetota bacterium]
MANGKPGDHPYTDIVHHGRDVYSPAAAALVRQIAALADDKTRRALAEMLFGEFNESSSPDVHELERRLAALRDRLAQEARDRGYEL